MADVEKNAAQLARHGKVNGSFSPSFLPAMFSACACGHQMQLPVGSSSPSFTYLLLESYSAVYFFLPLVQALLRSHQEISQAASAHILVASQRDEETAQRAAWHSLVAKESPSCFYFFEGMYLRQDGRGGYGVVSVRAIAEGDRLLLETPVADWSSALFLNDEALEIMIAVRRSESVKLTLFQVLAYASLVWLNLKEGMISVAGPRFLG